MGGKSKQAHRTKNNAQPSNSGRSAELLSQSHGVIPLSPLLGGGKAAPGLFASLASADHPLSTEYMLLIKKLNKKDPITKNKALNELVELVKTSSVEEVVSFLPQWTVSYRGTALDPDHRVREAAQVAHGAVMGAVGRRSAPHLRALVPVWVQAQHDSYAPAAHHAHLSLHSMFSESKLPEVILFCKEEIVSYLLDHIIGDVQQECRNKGMSEDSAEAVVERCAAGGLQGLRYLCERLPADQDEWLHSALLPLHRSRAYWALAHHQNPAIRCAWLSSMSGVAGRLRERYAEWGARAWKGLLPNTRGPAATAAWTALLHVIHHVPNWHTWMEGKNDICDRIVQVLELGGGGGEGSVVCACLLPLVAHLPADLLTTDWCHRLFIALVAGLIKKQTLMSKSERERWLCSIAECLRYVSVRGEGAAVGAAHRLWLEAVTGGAHDPALRDHLVRATTRHMAQLVAYWIGRTWSTDSYEPLIRNFWQNITSTLVLQTDKMADELAETVVDTHVALLVAMKTALQQTNKKKKSIKFKDECERDTDKRVEDVARETITEVMKSIDLKETKRDTGAECKVNGEGELDTGAEGYAAECVERYDHQLEEVVVHVVQHYLEYAQKSGAVAVVGGAVRLLREWGPGVSARVCADRGLEGAVRRWVCAEGAHEHHADLMFILLEHVDSARRTALLDAATQIPLLSPSVVWMGVRAARSGWPEARGYLRSAALAQSVLHHLDRHMSRPDPRLGDYLHALLTTADGEPVVSESCVRAVVERLRSRLWAVGAAGGGGEDVTALAGLARHVLLALRPDAELLTALVTLSADVQCEGEESEAAVRAACSAVLTHLPPAVKESCAPAILRVLLDARDRHAPASEVCESQIEHLVCILSELLEEIEGPRREELITLALEEPRPEPGSRPLEYFALRSDHVTGRLVSPLWSEEGGDGEEVEVEAVVRGARYVCWGARAVAALVPPDPAHTVHVLRHLAVLDAIRTNYQSWYSWDVVSAAHRAAEGAARAAVRESGRDLLRAAGTLARTRGRYYSQALRYVEEVCGVKCESDAAAGPDADLTGDGYYHTLQCSGGPQSCWAAAVRCAALRLRAVDSDGARAALLRLVERAPLAPPDSQLELLADAYYACNDLYLYDQDVSGAEWSGVWSSVSLLQLVAESVSGRGWSLSAGSWDLALIATHSLLHSLLRSMDSWGATKTSMVCVSVCGARRAVAEVVGGVRAECERRTPLPHVAALPREWADLFEEDVALTLHAVAHRALERSVCEWAQPLAASTWSLLPLPPPPPAAAPPPLSALLAPLVFAPAPHVAHMLLAYSALSAARDRIVLDDAETVARWGAESGDSEEERPPPPVWLRECLRRLEDNLPAVGAALLHITPFSASVCPWTPAQPQFGRVVQFLLGALIALEQMTRARGDLAHHYLVSFRASPLCDQLLELAGRPAGAVTDEGLLTAPLEDTPQLQEQVWSDLCRRMSARVAWSAGCAGCAGGGAWWRQTGSPLLARRVLRAVARDTHPPDLEVTAAPPDLTARLLVEERPVRLVLSLSPIHPQAPPTVSVSGAPDAGWLALVAWRGAGPGALTRALHTWREALLGLVAKTPSCYICYFTLHHSTGQPPRAFCHQCHNRFHRQCIRKWFTTSKKTNCPICRAKF